MENSKKFNPDTPLLLNNGVKALSPLFCLREPVIRRAIKALKPPKGSTGLDAGCGTGLTTLLLAEAVGSSGHVGGLDIDSESIKTATTIAQQSGFSDQISFQTGDLNNLPFDENAFDWAWSADCVGYAPMKPLPLVMELKRVVKPGGTITILAWSSEMLLPGYPILEARLNATASGISPFVKGKQPETHFLRSLGLFTTAGLKKRTVKTFAGGVHAPLSKDDQLALVELFKMRWSEVAHELSPQDFSEFKRLCSAESPEFIVNQSDYYAFFTYSMFVGQVG